MKNLKKSQIFLIATLALAVVLFVAVAFLVYGFSSISLGFKLYDVHRRARELQ